MSLTSINLATTKAVTSVVVRPREGYVGSSGDSTSSGSPQALVFLNDEIRELLDATPTKDSECGSASSGSGGSSHPQKLFKLSGQRLPVAGTIHSASHAVYEPTSDCIYYVDCDVTIARLDGTNTVSLVAGDLGSLDAGTAAEDGFGTSACFSNIRALAADGKGNIFIADVGCIRVLKITTGEVFTLHGSETLSGELWSALSYDTALDLLVACTWSSLWHVPLYGSPQPGVVVRGTACSPRLIAGQPRERGRRDATGKQARFKGISSMLAGSGSRLCLSDDQVFRNVDDAGIVTSTKLDVAAPGGALRLLAALPGGELACTIYHTSCLLIAPQANFTPCSDALAGRRRGGEKVLPGLHDLLGSAVDARSCGGGGSCSGAFVTVRVSGGQAFAAHRAVLTAHSAFLKQLLQPEGGFADSGAAEVPLPDAHPDVFGRLLSSMYRGVLDMPHELLRPAAELAGRLLMPVDFLSELQRHMLVTVTPGSVISDLVWAERHGMAELVPKLKAFALRHREEVAATGQHARHELATLAKLNPELTADFMMSLLSKS